MKSLYRLDRLLIIPALFALAIAPHSAYGTSRVYTKTGIVADSAHDSISINIRNAERLAASQPSASNYLGLSFAYYQAKRYNDCIAASRSALSLKPDLAEAYNNIAVGYQGLSKWDSAISASNEAIRLAPAYELAQNNLAHELSQKKLLDANIASAENALSSTPTAENYVSLSLAYYQAGLYQDCVTAANKALVLRPEYAIAWNNICAAYMALGSWDFAIVAGNQALRIDPTMEMAKNNLGFAMSQSELEKKSLRQVR